MRKCANISPYMRRLLVIYDFATALLRIYLYMMKIWFSFLSVYLIIEIVFAAIVLLLHKKKFFFSMRGGTGHLLPAAHPLLPAADCSNFASVSLLCHQSCPGIVHILDSTLKINKNIRSINADIWKVKKKHTGTFF